MIKLGKVSLETKGFKRALLEEDHFTPEFDIT
jgi:hypothetical protein